MKQRLLRSTALFFAVAITCGSLAACGSNAAAPTPATRPITKAEATAYAHAVNLRASDVTGTSITSPEREAPTPTPTTRQTERCVGNVNPTVVIADIHSATFTSAAHEEIHSSVEVLPSASIAAQNNAANRSQRAIKCAERFLPTELDKSNGSSVHYGHMSITRLANPLPGVPGSFGLRIAIPILGVPTTIEPTTPHLYLDAFAFLAGPAEVGLLTTSFPHPVSQTTETSLLSLLHSRAEANKLD
jgi:hypothetical protein